MGHDDEVGSAIRRLRELNGLTQADLAVALSSAGFDGIYPQTITKIEAGQRAVKYVEALAIADILHVAPGAFRPQPPTASARIARDVAAAASLVYAQKAELQGRAELLDKAVAELRGALDRANQAGVTLDSELEGDASHALLNTPEVAVAEYRELAGLWTTGPDEHAR